MSNNHRAGIFSGPFVIRGARDQAVRKMGDAYPDAEALPGRTGVLTDAPRFAILAASSAGAFRTEWAREEAAIVLKELRDARQVPGEARRRIFVSDSLDLTVWFDDDDVILGFELGYDKGGNERAVRWKRLEGFLHQKVDDGERRPGRHKETPILVPDDAFAAKKISRLFHDNSRDVDAAIADFVYRTLLTYPE